MVKALPETFKAWKDLMPGGDKKLIVIGEVECPTAGWNVSLTEAVPPGINPSDLILQINATAPNLGADVITRVRVRFEKKPPGDYRTVTIRGGGDDFSIDVGTAS